MTNLLEINLSWNKLEGSIPKSFYTLVKLRVIKLDNNNLSGIIEQDFENLQDLRYIDISRNKFSGNFPIVAGGFKNLKQLDFHGNQFEGFAPRSVQELWAGHELEVEIYISCTAADLEFERQEILRKERERLQAIQDELDRIENEKRIEAERLEILRIHKLKLRNERLLRVRDELEIEPTGRDAASIRFQLPGNLKVTRKFNKYSELIVVDDFLLMYLTGILHNIFIIYIL